MKTRVMAVLFAALVSTAAAQEAQFLLISINQDLTQTSATTVGPAGGTPYTFEASIDGEDVTETEPITSASVSLPGGSTSHSLTFNSASSDAGWRYQSTGYADLDALKAIFPAGDYTLNLTGTAPASGPATLTLPDAAPTLAAPLLTLTNGTWNGGVFYVTDVNAPVLISFNNVFSGTPGAEQSYHYYIDLNGPTSGAFDGPEGFIHYDPTTEASAPDTITDVTIDAGLLLAGNTYTIQVGYDEILSFAPALSGSAFAAALYSFQTTLTLSTSAVPEPASYAVIGGALALASGLILRRRRVIRTGN